jgi:hypothetical protein
LEFADGYRWIGKAAGTAGNKWKMVVGEWWVGVAEPESVSEVKDEG